MNLLDLYNIYILCFRIMPRRCVVIHCSNEDGNGYTLFNFPKDISLSKKWDKFVSTERADWIIGQKSKGQICSLHFVNNDFDNLPMWRRGFCERLKLKRAAIPTISLKRLPHGRKQELCRLRPATATQVSQGPQVPEQVPGNIMIVSFLGSIYSLCSNENH